jgi:hypothetical protein
MEMLVLSWALQFDLYEGIVGQSRCQGWMGDAVSANSREFWGAVIGWRSQIGPAQVFRKCGL